MRRSGIRNEKEIALARLRFILIVAAALIVSAFLFSACSIRQQTVSPPPIVSTHASFDGNVANSGLIGPDNQGGFYVTPHFIARYDSLLVKYGERLSPAVKTGDRRGIVPASDGNFQVTAEMVARFRQMNLWRKADAAP